MPDYSLSELARLADVTPRTVRYYIAQGLLPSPDAAGPATRYGDAHLARLRLIRRLQREHLPLAEIRSRLAAMSEGEIVAEVDVPSAAPADSALDYVRGLLVRETPAPYRATLARRVQDFALPPEAPDGFPIRDPGTGIPVAPSMPPPAPAAAPPSLPPPAVYPARSAPPAPPDRSTWERISLDADVELHVRRPLDRATNKRVERLVRIARELFEADAT